MFYFSWVLSGLSIVTLSSQSLLRTSFITINSRIRLATQVSHDAIAMHNAIIKKNPSNWTYLLLFMIILRS